MLICGFVTSLGIRFLKPVEFHGFKSWIVQMLPNAQKFNGIPVSEPISNQIVSSARILVSGNVCNADIVLFLLSMCSF